MIDPLGDHLIFLVSQPRAGSTLLQRILAGHPEIFATAEPWLMLHPLYALKTEGLTAEYDASQARAALKDFCESLPRGEESYVEAVRALGVALYNQALGPSGRSRFLDKTPRYYLVCDELRRTFPRAKFVLLLRNPLAVLASILTTWVKQDWPRLDRHRLDLVRAPGLLAEAITRCGDQAHVLRYEELVDAPEATVRRLCDHLGLEFHARMIDYGGSPKPRGRMGDGVGIHRHQRPVTESRDRWVEVLRGPRERLLAERYLDALDDGVLLQLGYTKEELRTRLRSQPAREGAVRPAWVAHAGALFGGAQSTPGEGPASAPVNRAHLDKAREFWNVARMEDAMFQRVFTSTAINAMTDEEKRAAWERSAVASANLVLEGLPVRAGWNVLEIGCGVGRIIKPLRERFARVDGVDISARMIEFARQYLAGARGSGRVLVNSGCDLADLPDHDYDLVYSMIVFQHIRSVSVVRSYLREVRRVLKPGGYFRLQVHRNRVGLGRADEEAAPGVQHGFEGNGYTEEELRALLVEAGFEIDALETRLNWIWATVRSPALNGVATGNGDPTGTLPSSNPAQSGPATAPVEEAPVAAPPRSPAEEFIAEADRHFRNGDLPNARAWLDRALDMDGRRADVLLARANLDVQLGDLPAAREALARAAEVKPDDVSLLVPLACVSLSLGHVEGFESALGRAMQIAPGDPAVRRAFADANFQCGRWPDAARAYFQLLQARPDDTGLLLPLGVCLARAGEADTAREVFRRILVLQPDHDLARENLAALEASPPNEARSASPVGTGQQGLEPPSQRALSGSDGPCSQQVAAKDHDALDRYFQPPAGSTERVISVRPRRVVGAARSAWQALKSYSIRHTGDGLEAVAIILEHILKNKLQSSWARNERFWAQTLVLPVECELRHAPSGRFFDDLKPGALADLGTEFAVAEAERAADILDYARQLREGADLGAPLYVTGALLKQLAPAAVVEPGAIYMVDGARRITASALCHRRTARVWLLLHESEFAGLVAPDEREALRQRLAALRWFESYQSIPLLGLPGQRTLRRFELMPLEVLRDAVVMDFGCNTGQACLKAAQAGARAVIGVEGMPDTFAAAREIARLTGLANVHFAHVDFNAPDFDRQIDAAWPGPVDYAFFFSVYRTKELTQREGLFRYILRKARKGIFFEGHAAPKIDTREYYDWLFDCFGVKGRFLGHSEGELRPLFFIDVTAGAKGPGSLSSRTSPAGEGKAAEAVGSSVTDSSRRTQPQPLPALAPERGQRVHPKTGSAQGDHAPGHGFSAGIGSESTLCGGAGEGEGAPGVATAESSAGPPADPLVSAIVSTYASERFMEGRLRDLLAQTLGDRLEIIVVDSGSPENEGAIVKRFAERHANIRYLRTEERETIYQAWNRGCRVARGRYLTNANTDDRLRPDALERLARELDEHPEVAVVYGDFFITNSENQEFHRHVRTGYSRKPDYHPGLMRDGCHIGPQPMWRRSLHDEIGWFDETLVAAGDYDFWCRAALKHPLRHVREFLGLYLHNATGICNGDTRRTEAETATVRRRYRRLFPKPPPDLPRGVFHREAARPGRYVNIGMVTFNRLDFTRRAIEALVRHTDFPYVLTVVDNASTDGTRDELRRLREQGVITNLILLNENVGVAKASNLAWAQEPEADYYLKLDNDIVLQKTGWLTRMVAVIDGVPQLGVLAYNFEPVSYPVSTINRFALRAKHRGNLGGACLLIPRRTERELGCWCEDYGLYGEEDADYAERVRLSGKLLAYMEDEDIGLHLPAGKAAAIDAQTFVAVDGVEEKEHREYREWKDRLRQENARSGGAYHRNVRAYAQKTKPLRCDSEFVRQYRAEPGAPTGKPPGGPNARASRTNATPGPETSPPPVPDLVSIIIPVCNRLDMTRPCLEAIRRETPAGAYEIIVVDNGSADGTREFLATEAAAGRLRTIRNETNLGFARAVNQGIEAARGGFVLLLNNDTVPLTGWLEALLAEARADSRVGLVGSLLLYPGGERIQHAGVTIGAGQGLLHPYHRHRLRHLDRVPAARESRDCQAVTGACVLVRREVIERVGALDEEYVNGFEDVDFCFRAITAGWRIRYCAASRVIHHESMTPGRKTHEQANYRRLNAAWKGRIQPDETPEQTTMGIQDVLCREKLVAEPGHVRAMEMLARFCLQRGDREEAAEWRHKLKAARESVSEPAGRSGGTPPAGTALTSVHSSRPGEDIASSRPPEVSAVPCLSRPFVSIVIPTFNNLALTRQCLGSLYRHAAGPAHEIIVVDNASTDGSVEWLKAEHAAGRLRVVLNPRNTGFARACNQGALEARGRFVLFLNNDTEVTPGWLEPLVAAAAEPQVGAVGARLLYPDGKIQHAGVEFIDGVPDHPFRRAAAEAPAVCQRRDLDMVTGACLLMPRGLFVALAGFDEVYQNGVEDVDLCLRVRTAGYRVVYEPGCVVTHHEGQSKGRFDHVSANLRRFFARWKDHLDEQHRLVVGEPRRIPSERSLLTETVSVAWEGSFLDLGSLSHVNRELTAALARHPRVKLTCVGRNVIPRALSGLPEIQAAARRLRAQAGAGSQVTVRHAWPPNWQKPRHGEWVLIQPWEFGALPADWVRGLEHVREAWVPSEFVRRCYIESGVDPGKVHVVPNGIDPERFRPDAPPLRLATKKKFKFLFVGGTIARKGPDVLLRAYLESFTADDDVCLVIKDFGGNGVYKGQTFEEQIRAARRQPNAPEILHLQDDLSAADIAGLYTACDCLVHPYRGEGFGLPVLEAMACGLPVIVTGGGAADDFATEEFVFRLPATRRGIGRKVGDLALAGEGWWLEPDLAALKDCMCRVFARPAEARERGRAASDHVRREWTWDQAAQAVVNRLQALAANGKPPPAVSPGTGPSCGRSITLPACARVGHLGAARDLVKARKLVEAWQATVNALQVRPFHPEAWVLLAEIARAAGDAARFRECADRARALAPQWKPARQLQKSKVAPAPAKVELPPLPDAWRSASRQPRLSVFVITRNEERFIGQCLESVRDIASQIVVVDTGSTDWTRDIAVRFGAEVRQFEWCDDFSAARNAALEHVTGDWVLMLDADEELMPAQKEKLRALMADASAIAWRLPMVDEGHEETGVSYVPRLFRNAPGLFYVGRIHEQIFASVEARRREWGLENKFGDATLLHHGYTKELVRSRDKVARNLRLLRLALEETPDEPNLRMNLGLELVRDGQVEAGIEQYGEAFRLLARQPAAGVVPEFRETLLTQFASHLVGVKAFARVIEVLGSPLARGRGLTASMHFLLGLAHLELKQYAEAADQMRECLRKRGEPVFSPVHREVRGAAPRHCLAVALAALKQAEAADAEFRQALADDPRSRPARFDYARFLAGQGREVDALKLLHGLALEKPDEPVVWHLGGRIALSRPEFLEVARDWTAEASRHLADHPALIEQRARALLLSGAVEEALPLWRRLASPAHAVAAAALVVCETLLDPALPATGPLPETVSAEFLKWYRDLITFGAEPLVLKLNERLDHLQAVVPMAAGRMRSAIAAAA